MRVALRLHQIPAPAVIAHGNPSRDDGCGRLEIAENVVDLQRHCASRWYARSRVRRAGKYRHGLAGQLRPRIAASGAKHDWKLSHACRIHLRLYLHGRATLNNANGRADPLYVIGTESEYLWLLCHDSLRGDQVLHAYSRGVADRRVGAVANRYRWLEP